MPDTPLEYQPRPATPARTALIAISVLVLCCLLWGYSFPTMQIAAGAFEKHVLPKNATVLELAGARGVFNGVRFLIAAALYAFMVAWSRRNKRNTDATRWGRPEWVGGFIVGSFFAIGMLLQVMGLCWTLPSVSAFLTSMAVVFSPIGQSLIFKRPVGHIVWLAVFVAVAGVVLLSWPKGGAEIASGTLAQQPPIAHLGEVLTVLAAMMFTAEILALDWFGKGSQPHPIDPQAAAPNPPRSNRRGADSTGVTLIMLATTGLLSLAAGLAVAGPGVWKASAWSAVATDRTVWWSFSTLIIFSSIMALSLMTRFQPRVSPAVASVVYCTEPIFGTLFSIAFATETLTWTTIAGGTAVLGAVAIVGLNATAKTSD